jgi:hypothetical protein
MGTSFTEYRGRGFWTRDAALETVLALLVLELEPLARQDPDLDPILDMWTGRRAPAAARRGILVRRRRRSAPPPGTPSLNR